MNNSTDVLHVIENGVEFFTIVATGESGMSQRGLSRACGKYLRSIQNLAENLTKGKAPKRLKRFIDKDIYLTNEAVKSGKQGQAVRPYKADFCFAVIRHYERLGSEVAEETLDAVGDIGLTSYIQAKTGWLPNEYQSSQQARESVNRIMEKKCPYEALYKKDMCETAFNWFGANFYWSYFYFWMSQQERCDLDNRNPPINGKRKSRIHQWIEIETKERLRDKAIELRALIVAARSKAHFIELFQNSYGDGWQMSIFD
jgi:hypothetical protein